MMKKGNKPSKKNSLLASDLHQQVFNSDGSFSSGNTVKKSKKLTPNKSKLMQNRHGKFVSPDRTVTSGEKRKLASSDESPKKKKKQKSSNSDTSFNLEKTVSDVSLSNSYERSVVKPSKHAKESESDSSMSLVSKSSKKHSPTKSKFGLNAGDIFPAHRIKSPEKSVKGKALGNKTKVTSNKKDLKKPEEQFDDSMEFKNEQSDSEDEDFADKIGSENEVPMDDSASAHSATKGDSVGWTDEQTQQLFDYMTSELAVKRDERSSFRQRLKKVSWDAIARQLDPPRATEECVQHVDSRFKKVNSTRNLSEMITAYQVRVKNRSKYYVELPIQRFRAENGAAIKKRGGNFFVTSKHMFDELPEDEKYNKYILPYQKELMEKNLNVPKKKGIAATHSAVHFYRKRHSDLSLKDAKDQYMQLSPKKRLPYIRQSYEELKFAWRAYEDLEPSFKDKSKPPFCHLMKEEWIILLKSVGMPVMDARGPKELFMQMNSAQDPDDRTSTSYFKNHPERNKYHTLFSEMRENFKKKFEEWMPSVNDDIMKKPASAYYEEVMSVRTNVRARTEKTSIISKIASKVQELEDSFVESSMVGNFAGEPKPPPMTAKECFIDYMKRANTGIKPKEINEKYREIPKEFQDKLIALAANSLEGFKEQVIEFVSNLPTTERKIYIGQNRIKYVKMFQGVDIFEEDYPCSEYPPFKKRAKAAVNKSNAASEEISTLHDFWTPKQKEDQRKFGSGKLSTSTPMDAEGHSTSLSQSSQTLSQQTRAEDESESSSDETESSVADSSGDFLSNATAVSAKSCSSSSSSSNSSDNESSEEDGVHAKRAHQPSPRTPHTMRDLKQKKFSQDPLSPLKLENFIKSKNKIEKKSSGPVNGAKASPKIKTPAETSVRHSNQNVGEVGTDQSSEEESDEEDEDNIGVISQLSQNNARRSASEDSSEEESEDELVPAWSKK